MATRGESGTGQPHRGCWDFRRDDFCSTCRRCHRSIQPWGYSRRQPGHAQPLSSAQKCLLYQYTFSIINIANIYIYIYFFLCISIFPTFLNSTALIFNDALIGQMWQNSWEGRTLSFLNSTDFWGAHKQEGMPRKVFSYAHSGQAMALPGILWGWQQGRYRNLLLVFHLGSWIYRKQRNKNKSNKVPDCRRVVCNSL